MLRILDGAEMSPKELASELGRSINTVAYHVKLLERDGLIRSVRAANRRGATEHYYTALVRVRVVVEEIDAD